MNKASLRQTKDYLLLLFITGLSIFFALTAQGNKDKIKIIVVLLSLGYFIWGIFHHKNERTLKREIVLEYAIYSLFGASIVIGLL